jgi:hypothetical protein
MSKQQYNLKTKTDYLNRKMFLDPAGPVTVQRFEEVKYNKLVKYEQEARGFFWVPEEIFDQRRTRLQRCIRHSQAYLYIKLATSNSTRQFARPWP